MIFDPSQNALGTSNIALPQGVGPAEPAYSTWADYSIADSLFRCSAGYRIFGTKGDALCKALRPSDQTSLSVAQADVGSKYGIRNYLRIATEEKSQIIHEITSHAIKSVRTFHPFKHAQSLVKKINHSYVFDRQVYEQKDAGRRSFLISCTSPNPVSCAVRRSSVRYEAMDSHSENVLLARHARVAIANNIYEMMSEIGEIGITQHALMRIWERSDNRHMNFHLALVDAYQSMLSSLALCTLAAYLEDVEMPAYLCAPFNDGMIIMSRRQFILACSTNRIGYQRSGKKSRIMQLREPDFFLEECYLPLDHLHQHHAVARDIFVGATYMGPNDIGNFDRVQAAQDFAELIGQTHVADAIFYFQTLGLEGDLDQYEKAVRIDTRAILSLQDRMLPRKDPPDDRTYVVKNDRALW